MNTPVIAPSAKPAALAGELADLVLELALALHKRAIYPAAHPLLAGAVDALWNRARAALQDRNAISLGVARNQLLVDGVSSDENHLHIRELAAHLHEHQIAAVHFFEGVTREELDDMLATVAVPASRVDRPLGTLEPEALARWRHIALDPLSFQRLHLIEGKGADADDWGESTEARELWLRMARAALVGQSDEDVTPDDLAHVINARRGQRAYEQEVIDIFVQVVSELDKLPKGSRTAARLRERISSLLSSLNPETLARLVGEGAERDDFLKAATEQLSASAVLDLIQASASASNRTISDAMLRLLRKLARNSDGSRVDAASSDRLLRSQVRRMLEGWTLQDPNPDGYSELLRGIGHSENRNDLDRERDVCEPERIVEISCECAVLGPATEVAITRWVNREGMASVLDRLTVLPPGDVRERLIDSLVNGAMLDEQLAAERPDVRLLEHVVLRMRERATKPLIEALGRRDERDASWLADLLARTGSSGTGIIVDTLMERSPFVQRVLLTVLDKTDDMPPFAALDVLSTHEDSALRREALRLMMKEEATREVGVQRALRDPDERMVSLALAQALKEPTPSIVSAIMDRVDMGEELSADVRSRAIRAVAASGSEAVVPWLCDLVLTQHWLLRFTKLRKPSPESIGAVAALAAHWAEHRDAALALRLARRSRDVRYRHALRRAEER